MIVVKYRHCDRSPDTDFRMLCGAREQVKLHNGFCLQPGRPCAYIAESDQPQGERSSGVSEA